MTAFSKREILAEMTALMLPQGGRKLARKVFAELRAQNLITRRGWVYDISPELPLADWMEVLANPRVQPGDRRRV